MVTIYRINYSLWQWWQGTLVLAFSLYVLGKVHSSSCLSGWGSCDLGVIVVATRTHVAGVTVMSLLLIFLLGDAPLCRSHASIYSKANARKQLSFIKEISPSGLGKGCYYIKLWKRRKDCGHSTISIHSWDTWHWFCMEGFHLRCAKEGNQEKLWRSRVQNFRFLTLTLTNVSIKAWMPCSIISQHRR